MDVHSCWVSHHVKEAQLKVVILHSMCQLVPKQHNSDSHLPVSVDMRRVPSRATEEVEYVEIGLHLHGHLLYRVAPQPRQEWVHQPLLFSLLIAVDLSLAQRTLILLFQPGVQTVFVIDMVAVPYLSTLVFRVHLGQAYAAAECYIFLLLLATGTIIKPNKPPKNCPLIFPRFNLRLIWKHVLRLNVFLPFPFSGLLVPCAVHLTHPHI